MNKNTKIAIGLLAVVGLYFAWKKGVFGGESESESSDAGTDNTPLKSSPVSVPIVMTASESSTPQVVDLKTPPQFTQVVTASNIPATAGSYKSYSN
jgi:hypothetical protein